MRTYEDVRQQLTYGLTGLNHAFRCGMWWPPSVAKSKRKAAVKTILKLPDLDRGTNDEALWAIGEKDDAEAQDRDT